MLEVLTGTGLSTAAGLNAYIPLVAMGLLARYTKLIDLPAAWTWLGNGWVLLILLTLLLIEVVADKIPAVDSVNDVLQTLVRPAAGGMAFAAGSGSQTVTVRDPADLFTEKLWIPIVLGLLISLSVHSVKAATRPIVNVATVGVGAPVVSTVEDATSTGISLAAILVPVLVVAFIVLLIWLAVRTLRRRRTRRVTAPVP